jgi:uncharacterized protein (TIGR02246 family)
MGIRLLCYLVFSTLAYGFTVLPVRADDPQGNEQDKSAIKKNAEAFVEAFHKADAQAVAAFWTPDGDYTDASGRRLKGREAIEKAFADFFAEAKGAKVGIEATSLRFVTPDVALEEGTSEVFPADGRPPSQARYSIVHVKKDGKWLLSSVRDTPFVPPNNYEHLRGLEWAIGDWEGPGEQGAVEQLSVAWTESRNFIHSRFSTSNKNVSVGSATQVIGWDPLEKRIRSWIFDETGGFGEGSWNQDGQKWVLKTASVRQDGKKAAATYILTPVDADTITLQAKERTENGSQLPDTKEIQLKRVK